MDLGQIAYWLAALPAPTIVALALVGIWFELREQNGKSKVPLRRRR
jgi:hypothetical protein